MFYYYGSKNRLTRRYPVPQHPLLIEPFAGSGAYAVYHLVRRHVDRAILVDKDPRVVDTWHRLLAMTPHEVRSLQCPEPGTQSSDFLVMTSMVSNAVAMSSSITVTERMVDLWQGMTSRIARVLPAVQRGVEVRCGDYAEALKDVDTAEATWFVDPPYQVLPGKGSAASTANPQGNGYARGCRADDLNFEDLADWCRSRRGLVIVAEQIGATWLPFRPLIESESILGEMRTEAIWTQGRTDNLFGDA